MTFLILLLLAVLHLISAVAAKVISLTSWELSGPHGAYNRFAPLRVNVTVPSTVLGSLFASGMPGFDFDPVYGKNLGRVDPALFSAGPWRYETNFKLPYLGGSCPRVVLKLKGVNYKADLYVDGNLVAARKDLVGTFRHFLYDITSHVCARGLQASYSLRLDVYQPHDYCFPPANNSTDLALTFVDWAPHPPDYSMGLFRPVSLLVFESSPFVVASGAVVSSSVSSDLGSATLSVSFLLQNVGPTEVRNVACWVDLGLGGKRLVKSVSSLAAGSEIRVEFSDLRVTNPSLWWPWQMGEAKLHTLTIGTESTTLLQHRYGIREVTTEMVSGKYLRFRINHRPLLILAGGWAPDLFLRLDTPSLRSQLFLTRHMGLNAIRLEGKMEVDELYDLADEMGILMLPGWCCCDAWQHWRDWTSETYKIAGESMRTQARRLAIHPSVAAFFYSSDQLPPADVEKLYLNTLDEEKWPNPTIAAASKRTSSITGPTGVKMSGPYSWVPPVYWLEDTHKLGGAYGFLTEGGPGESPMTLLSMKRTIPEAHLWDDKKSMSDWWDYHCGNPVGLFGNLRFFTRPLNGRHGEGKSAEDYLYKAQAMAYEGMRSMYEGYNRNKHQNATGVVQWMLNNAFPQNVWHLYDSYLAAGGGYYGTRKANEPLHAMLSYTDGTVWLINSLFKPVTTSVSVKAQVVSLKGEIVWHKTVVLPSVDSDAAVQVPGLVVPMDGTGKFGPKDTFFVRLVWQDTSNRVTNLYWLSPTMDVLDWSASKFYRTPCKQWADFKQLQTIPQVKLHVTHSVKDGSAIVEVQNPADSPAVAFFVDVRVLDRSNKGYEITPVFWTDNYFSLLPGEVRTVSTVLPSDVEAKDVEFVVRVWNNVVGGN